MEGLSLREAIRFVGGEFRGNTELLERRPTGVSIDSRTLNTGELFFALRGENTDGHHFVDEALKAGACVVVVEKGSEVTFSPAVYVNNTLKALGDLAKGYREKWNGTVVGITGTTGKTTVKGMAETVLRRRFNLHATPGNYNNLIGVPLTLFGINRFHECAIVEIGMNHSGEIRRLACITKPQIGIITNIGPAHLEFFHNMEEIADAKGELLDIMEENTVALLNNDDELLKTQWSRFKGKIVSFGLDKESDVRGKILDRDSRGNVTFEIDGEVVHLSIAGSHNVYNALAVFALGREMGLPSQDISSGLEKFRPEKMRMEFISAGGVMIINDSYNANPQSMRAAFDVLSNIEIEECGKKFAVLGDMLELGDASDEEHKKIGRYSTLIKGLSGLYFVGDKMSNAAQCALDEGMDEKNIKTFKDIENAWWALRDNVRKGDIVLVKGSRGMQMDKIVGWLERYAGEGRA